MTTFEYFKAKYDENHDYMVMCIRKDIPVDSFHFLEVATRFCWGGTCDVDPYFCIKGVTDTKEMNDAGWLWLGYVSDGHGGTVRKAVLTKKGLRAFYKAMF